MINDKISYKVAKPITGQTYTKRLDVINNYKLVPFDYNFVINNDEDVTNFHNLNIFFGIGRFNFKVFRQSLINSVLPSWSGFINSEKKELVNQDVYPDGTSDSELITILGSQEELDLLKSQYSPFLLSDDRYVIFTGYSASTNNKIDFISGNTVTIQQFTGYTGTTTTDLTGINNDISYLSGQTDLRLLISDFNAYTGDTETLINTKYDKSGGTINGNVQINEDLIISGETFLSGITEIQQDVSYGTPRPTALPSTNDTFNNVFVYGTGGPDLTNVTSWTFNWDLPNNGLYTFAFNTSDGIPSYYVNLLPSTTQTFNQVNPDVTLSGTGVTDLDDDYWVNKIGSDIVFVSKTNNFAIYLTNDSSGYSPPVYNSTIVSVDSNKKTLNTGIKPFLYGSEFHFIEDLGDSTTSSTSPQTKLTLTTNDLPNGRYKISASWGWTHNATNNNARFDIQLNGSTMGGILEEEPKDTSNRNYEHRVFYKILTGINDITLRYWNEGSSTTIFEATLELIRVE